MYIHSSRRTYEFRNRLLLNVEIASEIPLAQSPSHCRFLVLLFNSGCHSENYFNTTLTKLYFIWHYNLHNLQKKQNSVWKKGNEVSTLNQFKYAISHIRATSGINKRTNKHAEKSGPCLTYPVNSIMSTKSFSVTYRLVSYQREAQASISGGTNQEGLRHPEQLNQGHHI
jgi:hypothetical protein